MSDDYPAIAYAPSYASYNWTGAPSDWTLSTNAAGGDSGWSLFCKTLMLLLTIGSTRKLEQMVPTRRSGLYYRGFGYGKSAPECGNTAGY